MGRKKTDKDVITSVTAWKKALLLMLEDGNITISNRFHNSPMNVTDSEVKTALDKCHNFKLFVSELGFLSLPISQVFFQLNPSMSNESAILRRAHLLLGQLMEHLEKLGYVDAYQVDMGEKSYCLNKIGIGVALNIQEHDDNKERFKQTQRIMTRSMIAAFIIAGMATLNFFFGS